MAVTLDNEFADLILKFTDKAGIALTGEQAHLLSLHIQPMLQWNTRLNLTRITGREEIVVNISLIPFCLQKILFLVRECTGGRGMCCKIPRIYPKDRLSRS